MSTPALGNASATDMIYTHYDAMGRVIGSRQDTAGSPYLFSYIYNDLSLDTEAYPSGRRVESCYDSAGRISQTLNVTQTPAVAYTSNTYQLPASGGIAGTLTATKTLGNSLIETDTTNTLLQTTAIQLGPQGSPGSVFSLAYGYGTSGSNNGNVLSQTITRGAASGGLAFAQTYVHVHGRVEPADRRDRGANAGQYGLVAHIRLRSLGQ